ncbi:hypothetical protein Hdeb2414_s0214g00836001 [Helianthus debilis subsp. tardiflorus]
MQHPGVKPATSKEEAGPTQTTWELPSELGRGYLTCFVFSFVLVLLFLILTYVISKRLIKSSPTFIYVFMGVVNTLSLVASNS